MKRRGYSQGGYAPMIDLFTEVITIPGAMCVLPDHMDSPEAHAMLLAIGLQESRFKHRRQIGGPARGFWQFERSGVLGVNKHHASREHIVNARRTLGYTLKKYTASAMCDIVQHNDVLACVYARLLLWTLPDPLPGRDDVDGAWDQYIAAWRPGKPHRTTWNDFHSKAWELIDG